MSKNRFFYFISITTFVSYTNFAFPNPILPDFFNQKAFSSSGIDIIGSFYYISNILASLISCQYLVNFSKSKVMIIGYILLISSNIFFGFLDEFTSEGLIIFLASSLRIIQGIALAMVILPIYAYIPVIFPDKMENKYVVLEIMTWLGLDHGPGIAGFLYDAAGFNLSFNIMSIFYFLTAIIFLPFINKCEKIIASDKPKEQAKKIEASKPITVHLMYKNKNFLLTMSIFTFSLMSNVVILPAFFDHIHQYQETDSTANLILGLGNFAFVLTGIFFIKVISKMKINSKHLFLIGGALSFLSLLIIGPEEYTFLPHKLPSVIAGILILGCSQMFYLPILIPELIKILKEIDPKSRGIDEMASGLLIVFVGITAFLGVIVGRILSNLLGFERGMSVYAVFLLGILLLYGFKKKIKALKKIANKTKLEIGS